MALDEPNRQAAAQGVLDEQLFTLLGVSERLASWAVRKGDPELIALGLVALGVAGWQGDWRERAILIALHYDAAQRMSADAESLFERAAALLSPKAADALRSFLRRAAADRKIEAMGYKAGADADGFRYQRQW